MLNDPYRHRRPDSSTRNQRSPLTRRKKKAALQRFISADRSSIDWLVYFVVIYNGYKMVNGSIMF